MGGRGESKAPFVGLSRLLPGFFRGTATSSPLLGSAAVSRNDQSKARPEEDHGICRALLDVLGSKRSSEGRSAPHERCLSNRRLVVLSLQRIALSRRLLNPGWAREGDSGDRDLSSARKVCVLCEEPLLLGVECEISGLAGSGFTHCVCSSPWWGENGGDASCSLRRC